LGGLELFGFAGVLAKAGAASITATNSVAMVLSRFFANEILISL
jgi:hypothetical protein